MKFLLMITLVSFYISAAAKDFYVSPKGNNANDGTREMPFQTIDHAKSKVREWNRAHGTENIVVWLSGGVYSRSQTLVFGLDDSAKPGQTIQYAAIPGEKPVINSDVTVTGWKKLGKAPAGLSKEAKGKVWVTTVTDSVSDFKVMYNAKGMLPRARTHVIAHIRKSDDWFGNDEFHTTIPFVKETVAEIFNPVHAEILVIGAAPWTMNILPVRAVDTSTGVVSLGASSTYALAAPRYYRGPETIWVENTFAGLDSAGKWVFDKEARLLYFWPSDSKKPEDQISIPRLVEMIRVEGKINADAQADSPVTGIIFKGITFNHGNRFDNSGKTGFGIQHDWEKHDASTGLVRFRGTENCGVEDCIFIDSGGSGIRFDLHAQRNKVIGSEFSQLGGGAILLAGYGPGTKDVNKYNVISNNYIHHVGTLWWHSLGIWAWQSGHNEISHNDIHNVPYTAIAVTGRIAWDKSGTGEGSRTVRWSETGPFTGSESWEERERFLHGRHNIIEHNDIHHVMDVMEDGNAVYISGAGHGNIVRGNFVHDTPSMAAGEAIRCDDDQHETLIENNIVFRYGTHGIGIASKGRNHIINNIIACPPARVNRGMLSMETNPTLYAGSAIYHNILYATQAKQPFVAGVSKTKITLEIDKNIYFNSSDSSAANTYLEWAHKNGLEKQSIQSDPLFEDINKGNFKLLPNSPAIKLGFRPFILQAGRIRK